MPSEFGETEGKLLFQKSLSDEIKVSESEASQPDNRFTLPSVSYELTNQGRQEALNAALGTISSYDSLNESDVKSCITFFETLYCGSNGDDNMFRHSYAAICEVMIGDYDTSNTEPDYEPTATMEHLSNNISLIQAAMEDSDCLKDAKKKFDKLVDHVMLEYQRLNYTIRQNKLQHDNADGSTKRFKYDLRTQKTKLDQETRNLSQRIKEKEDQIDRMQKEYIAILGIFAAVIIATNGGIVFTSSSIQALAGENVAYLAFIISIVGTFIFNILYALFTFVYRMVRQDGSYWGILSKDMFIKINKMLIFIDMFLLLLSLLMYSFEIWLK